MGFQGGKKKREQGARQTRDMILRSQEDQGMLGDQITNSRDMEIEQYKKDDMLKARFQNKYLSEIEADRAEREEIHLSTTIQEKENYSEAIKDEKGETFHLGIINITSRDNENITPKMDYIVGILRRDEDLREAWQQEPQKILSPEVTTTWLPKIRELQRTQEIIRLVVSSTSRVEMRNELWRVRTESNEKILLPNGGIQPLINAIHEWLAHASYQITYAFMKRYFWTLNLREFVIETIDNCGKCNIERHTKRELLQKHDQEIAGTEKEVAIRLIGPLGLVNKNVCFIAMIINLFTGHVKLYPMKGISTHELICLITTRYFLHEQIPKRIMANELVFRDSEWREFLQQYGCEDSRMPFSGVWSRTRRMVKEIDRIIEIYKKIQPIDPIIEHIERILNCTVQRETKYAAEELRSDESGQLPMHPNLISPKGGRLVYASY